MAEEFALDDKAKISNPALHPKHVVIGDDGAVRHHGVQCRGVLDADEQIPTQLSQCGHELRFEIAVCAQLLDKKSPALIVDLGLLKDPLPVLVAGDTTVPLYGRQKRLGLVAEFLMLDIEPSGHAPLMRLGGQLGIVLANLGQRGLRHGEDPSIP